MSDLFSPVSILSKLSLQKAQRNLDDSKGFLYNDFRGMAKILSLYNPLEVMKMSLWEERRIFALLKKDEIKRKAAVLLPIVLQSIVESDMMEIGGKSLEIKEKDWERLKSLSEDIVRRMVRIIDSMVAIAINKGDADLDTAEGLRKSIEKRLLPEFVDQETQEREIWELKSLFEEIPDFQSRMGCDYISFIINIQNIAKVGLNGIDELVRDVALYKEEYSLSEAQMRASGELDGLTESQIFDKITKKNHWEGRAASLSERRDGYSLFMPSSTSSLPLDAYAQYSVKASSLNMDAFLTRGFWPAVRYPFFEMEEKVYTFVAKHIPFFMSLTSLIDRFLASSRDVLSIFYLSDCDTYTYDGNKIEISVLPSVLDVNPVLYPSSFRDILRRRKAEGSVQRKLGHKKLVVDPDMEEDKVMKDDVLYISSSFLSRATVDKNTKRDLLSSLLGNLDLPEEESVYMDTDDYVDTTELSNDDLMEEKTSFDFEYEYNDVDEDEMARKLDERDENITLIEYDKTLPTEEEKKSLIDRYSLTDEIIRKNEEEEKIETQIEEALDDDIFDDSEEEERLDDIGGYEGESEYYEEVEAADEYSEEEKTPEDSQLDFFSILDEEAPEEIEFGNELDEEEEESFKEEERREEILDSDITLPGDSSLPIEEEIMEEEQDSSISEKPLEEDFSDEFDDTEESEEEETEEELSEDDFADDFDDTEEPIEEEEEVEEPLEEELSEEDSSDDFDDTEEPVEEEETEESLEDEITEEELSDDLEVTEEEESSLEDDEEEISEEEESPSDSPLSESVEREEESESDEESSEEKKDDSSFLFDDEDDNQSLPIAEVAPKKEMSFADSLFAALGVEDDEEDVEETVDEIAVSEEETVEEETPAEEESPFEEEIPLEEDTSNEEEAAVEEEAPSEEETVEETETSENELEIAGVIGEIYKLLGPSSAFGDFIKLSDEDTLSDLDEAIESCWNRQQMEGKDKMFNIPDYSLSIILARDSVRDELRLSELLNNAGGVMYSRDSESWNAVIVYIDPSHTVEKALEKTISKDTFSPSDWKRVTYIGEQMKKR